MIVINARNVNDAYTTGLEQLWRHALPEQTRGGECLVMPWPVMTVYRRPLERMLWDPQRNANPFFHLAESLWMLAGLRNARWLDQFVHDFSSRFAEEDGEQHGAYGYRWRWHFELEGGGGAIDQLDTVVKLLRANHSDRRVVLTMWDPMADLGANKKDVPCNTHAYLRVRSYPADVARLDLTVCCRSNDIVWGAYGANAVHFSVLQEYLAARIGCQVGMYYQFSNNFHGYRQTTPSDWVKDRDLYCEGVRPTPMWNEVVNIDTDLEVFFHGWDGPKPMFYNTFLSDTAWPLLKLYGQRKELVERHVDELFDYYTNDWGIACCQWLRRFVKRREKTNVSS